LVSSQPPFAASLSPPLSAPRPLSDSAASVRDAFGILAMADLMQASFCSFGLAKRLKNRRFNMQGIFVLWKSNLKALKRNLRASKPNLKALKMTARGS